MTSSRSSRQPADELVELEAEQPAVGAELDDVAGDLVVDPAHHLEALDDVATSRTVTRSSISSAESVPVTSSRRDL